MNFGLRSTGDTSTEDAVQPLTGGDPEECASEGLACPEGEEQISAWKFCALKVIFSLSVFLTVTFLLEHFAEDTVTSWSETVIGWIGLPGLFAGVFLADGLPQPFTYVPLIFMAVKGSVPKPLVFGICGAASYSAGLVGYFVGAGIKAGNVQCLDDLLKRFAAQALLDIMARKGALGVAFVALMPIPLAIATWTAGYIGVDFRQFLLAPLCRLPKIAIFVLLSRPPQGDDGIIEDTVVDS
mmetsp:Transcript_123464/g.384282  ORF Transcript_123464/g.384282 Transcript_123464/m.384282 type:complete len:240 (-) Transcript_123464:61-780(-)